MSTTLWILLAFVFALVCFVMIMRGLLRRSRDADKRIDFRNVLKWKDDDDE